MAVAEQLVARLVSMADSKQATTSTVTDSEQAATSTNSKQASMTKHSWASSEPTAMAA